MTLEEGSSMKIPMIGAIATALVAVPALALQTPRTVPGELILYQDTSYNGEEETLRSPRSTVRTDWNIRSIAIHPGERWQICVRPRFRDPCIVLDRSVPDASVIGVEGQIGSARLAPAPAAAPAAPSN
jgi:hypothetical protein